MNLKNPVQISGEKNGNIPLDRSFSAVFRRGIMVLILAILLEFMGPNGSQNNSMGMASVAENEVDIASELPVD